jgi:hypothetical protein
VQRAAPRSQPSTSGLLTPKQSCFLLKPTDDASASPTKSATPPAKPATRRDLFTGTTAGVLGACMCGICGPTPVRAAMAGDWGYGPKAIVIQQAGAYAWGATCAVGSNQSPVDLPFSKQQCATKDIRNEPVKRITTRFRFTEQCCITNAGHGTMQVCLRSHLHLCYLCLSYLDIYKSR